MVWDDGVATASGVGFTNTVAVVVGPVHPLAVGVIVNVTVIGALVVLVNVPLILPLPLAAIPVTVATLSLVQAYVVAGTVLLSTIVVIATPEHWVCDAGVAVATGAGLMVTVNEQLAVLPDASVAVAVTVVVPLGKTLPDAGTDTTVTPGQLSLNVGAG